MNDTPQQPMLTPTEGDMTQEQHTAFILRIFQYLVETSDNGVLEVDLNDVMAKTTGRILQVRMEGHTFQARTMQGLLAPQAGEVPIQ